MIGFLMILTFWGVRGSHPVPGPDTARYGGHTSCVEVSSQGGSQIIIDAGTGLRSLGKKCSLEQNASGEGDYHFLLSHVHWDHIQGLPFFQPIYKEGTKIHIYAMRSAADELQSVIGGITTHEFFPTPLEATPAEFEFVEVTASKGFKLNDFSITPFALNHPFGSMGYRLDADGSNMAYVCDTAPFDDMLHKKHFLNGIEHPDVDDQLALSAMKKKVIDTIRGVDTVIFDTHFLPEEYKKYPHWGHSTPEHAIELCEGLGIRRLILFHHAPSRSDTEMDKLEEYYRQLGRTRGLQVIAARESMALSVGLATNPGFMA